MLSALLLLVLTLLWHNGDGARSQRAAQDGKGTLHLSVHPDEGLRQIAHFFQKRQGDDRKSGALPDPAALSAETLARAPDAQALHLAQGGDLPAPAAPRATKLPRAPPRLSA